jgi:putative selenate reductase FAD-binding subunit
MSPIEYLRPTSLDEAIDLLQRGVPLGGGTELVPRRKELKAVIDLSGLGLNEIQISQSSITLGATTRLQRLVEREDLLEAVRHVCRLESGWNMRNMITVGGAIEASDGRSPLLTLLLALGAVVHFEPDSQQMDLNDYLEIRGMPRIICKVEFPNPQVVVYEQVARSRRDLPIVCAVLARREDKEPELSIALGGYGQRPIRIQVVKTDLDASVKLAKAAYSEADDVWASGEYRSHVASILVQRLLQASRSQ